MTFINHNGKILPQDTPVFTAANRAFRYGDALFETMWCEGGSVRYLSDHAERLGKGMRMLGMEASGELTAEAIGGHAATLAEKNGLDRARIRLEVYRDDGGYYAPETNTVSFVMEAGSLPLMENTAVNLGLYEEVRLPVGKLSNLKSCNRLPNVMAARYAQSKGFDDCLLLNEDGNIAEAISSNVFVVKDGTVITPLLADGCVAGIMRKQVLKLLRNEGLPFRKEPVSPGMLTQADEIFLTNVIRGIVLCSRYGNKVLGRETTTHLQKMIASQ